MRGDAILVRIEQSSEGGRALSPVARVVDEPMLRQLFPEATRAHWGTTAFWLRYFGRISGQPWTNAQAFEACEGRRPFRGMIRVARAERTDDPPSPASGFIGLPLAGLSTRDPNLAIAVVDGWETVVLSGPQHDGMMSWAAGTVAAAHTMAALGVPCAEVNVDYTSRKVSISRKTLDIQRHDKGTRILSTVDVIQAYWEGRCPAVSEARGGPGFEAVFSTIDRISSQPIVDVDRVVRWAVLGVLFSDTLVDAGHVVFVREHSGWRLMPFAPLVIKSGESGSALSAQTDRGMRIGREWPSEHIRADHWIEFSRHAGVRPKVVFRIIADYAKRAPALVQSALIEFASKARGIAMSSASIRRGETGEMIDTVQRRASRLADLSLVASRYGVAGMKNRPAQPTNDPDAERVTDESGAEQGPIDPQTVRRYPIIDESIYD